MFHGPQLLNAYKNGVYDLKPEFKEIKSLISAYDLSIGNFETAVNPKLKVSGYPVFNSPTTVIDAVKYAGFDILDIANNHILDSGSEGFESTISNIKSRGLKVFGIYSKSKRKSTLLIVEKNGIKFGFLGFTATSNRRVDGNSTPSFFTSSSLKEITLAKKNCDFLIVYTHMGTEYMRTSTSTEVSNFNKIADSGADWVINSHPHVARQSRIYKTKDGRKVMINESLGNFISNQNDIYTDIGLVCILTIEKDVNGSIRVKNKELKAIYRLRYTSKADGKIKHIAVDAEKAKLYSEITVKQIQYIDNVRKWLINMINK